MLGRMKWRRIRSFVRHGVLFALWSLLFYFAAQFTPIQSCVLSVIGLLSYHSFDMSWRQKERNPPYYQPFRLYIWPEWKSICEDFDFVPIAVLERAEQRLRNNDGIRPEFSALREGIAITVLKPSLLFLHGPQTFITSFPVHYEIKELESDPSSGALTPRLSVSLRWVRDDDDFLEISYLTDESVRNGKGEDGYVRVCRLPWRAVWWTNPPDYFSWWDEENSLLHQEMDRCGWTWRKEGLPGEYPYPLSNKYCKISIQRV